MIQWNFSSHKFKTLKVCGKLDSYITYFHQVHSEVSHRCIEAIAFRNRIHTDVHVTLSNIVLNHIALKLKSESKVMSLITKLRY